MVYKIKDGSCCNECCDECKEPKLEIEWGDCIEVDKTEKGKYIINNKAETIVKSTDGTVDVQYIEGTHENDCKKVVDLSVACEDKKVGVCASDTPWFLPDKIKTEWGIKMTTTCNSHWYITLSTDIVNTDEKVAVSQWCDPVYLSDAIKCTSSYVDIEQVDCKLVIKDKQSELKPIMKVRLENTTMIKQEIGIDVNYVLAWWEAVGSEIVIPSNYSMELSIGEAQGTWITHWLNSKWFCVIPIDGIYRCTYGGCLEVAAWVIAWRTYLYHWGWGSTNPVAMESRSWGGMWEMTPWIDPSTYSAEKYWQPLWYEVMNQSYRASLGRYVPRQSFNGTTIVRCLAWDIFALWVKISSSVSDPAYDTSQWAQFQIQSKHDSWPGGDDEWAYYVLEWIAPLI